MTIAEFLASLRERDVKVWAEGDRVRCSAPAGVLGEETKAELASRKEEILAFFRHAEALKSGPRAIVPLKAVGGRPPIYAFPGHNGDVFCYVELARWIGFEQPLFGVEPPGLADDAPIDSVEALARYAVDQIRSHRSQGPYLLAGYCAGGTIAFEVARQLAERGERVDLLALISSAYPTLYRPREQARRWLHALTSRAKRHRAAIASGGLRGGIAYVQAKFAERRMWRRREQEAAAHNPLQVRRARLERVTLRALSRYAPRPYLGRVDLFLPSEAWRASPARPDLWKTVAGAVREHVGPDDGDPDAMLMAPNAAAIAAALGACTPPHESVGEAVASETKGAI